MSDATLLHRYARPESLADALALLGADGQAAPIAGGTDLVPLSRARLREVSCVVDLARLPLATVALEPGGELRLGAMLTLSDAARHPLVLEHLPLMATALEASASAQIRHRATLGGNLLQAPRCPWLRSGAPACNRREPGSGCGAQDAGSHEGQRWLSILGADATCAAASTSDLAVALLALDASVELASPRGERRLPLAALWSDGTGGIAPGTPTLAHDELITAIRVPLPPPGGGQRVAFEKVRDRASFEFAVVSVAAAVCIRDGVVRTARWSAGGVAPAPWRLREVEAAMLGRPVAAIDAAAIGHVATVGARPLDGNAFKARLLRGLVQRVVEQTMEPDHD